MTASEHQVTSSKKPNFFLLTCANNHFDSSVGKSTRLQLQQSELSSPKRIVFDLGRTATIDAGGLGVLVSIVRFVGEEGEVVLASPSPAVEKAIEVARLDKLFRLSHDVEAAASHFSQLVSLQRALEETTTVQETQAELV